MNRSFRVEPEAADELDHAVRWYEQRRPGLGGRFLAAVDACLDFIDRWPGSGSMVPRLASDLVVRRAPVRRFPYQVVYLETANEIRILAFAHDQRRPGYSQSRI